jgi:hypothetical protein
MNDRLVAISVLVAAALFVTSAQATPGFVSGELLKTWCSKNAGLDREACYSYLRGASDAFHAFSEVAAVRNGTAAVSQPPNQCMPARISITTLRDIFLSFAANHPERMENQAAVLIAEIMYGSFPCPAAAREKQ